MHALKSNIMDKDIKNNLFILFIIDIIFAKTNVVNSNQRNDLNDLS